MFEEVLKVSTTEKAMSSIKSQTITDCAVNKMTDSWDKPEFEERVKLKRELDNHPLTVSPISKKSITCSFQGRQEGGGKMHEGGGDKFGSKVELQIYARSQTRRSFCNFNYMTTQGGSSHAEPGDDPSLQSPETESSKALKLLEFARDEHELKTEENLPEQGR
mmetsp:Transcript_29431/g.44907  ORF Transcript_29431/g.44907 Transcript_29431/m.44907 type:complete len:163 (+) Transcript_29431:118-606(+)